MQKNQSTRYLLDPELYPLIDAPEIALSAAMLPDYRKLRSTEVIMADTDKLAVDREEVLIPLSGGPDVRCLLYTPRKQYSRTAGYLHIHGGGYVLGNVEGSDLANALIASRLSIVVLSVDYRLAPEHPIPAPLDDCYSGLEWLHQNAKRLNINPAQIGVGGESAGGGLAAALAILARDRGELPICHQHLTYPMLDNLTGSEGHEGDPLVGEFIWTRERNRFGWECYLGNADPVAPQVPSRVNDYSGLPSTWMFTASMDLFRDENLDYARQLLAAGVPTDVLIYSRACHGFQLLPGTKLAKRFRADHLQALSRGLSLH